MTAGLIINPQDLSKRWIDRMADSGLDILGIHSDGGKKAYEHLEELVSLLETEDFRGLIDYARSRGVKIEYELHAVGYLVPRSLFSEKPEYFRMNSDGERTADWNFCVTNPDALELCVKRAAQLASKLYGSEPNFYFWMDDGLDTHCTCERCRRYSPSEQQLIVINAMIREIRKSIPEAKMPYLAYLDCIVPPKNIEPEDGVFMEYAPFAKYTAVGEGAEERKAREQKMLEPLIKLFDKEPPKVLEYWFDNSIFSKRVRPPKKFTLDEKMMREDIKKYAELGFGWVTSFACFLGEDYYELWGDFDISSYAEAVGKSGYTTK